MSNLTKFAKKLELKLKLAQNKPTISQLGTTELFFNNENNQLAFNKAIQDTSGPIYKFLVDTFNKLKGTSCSFNLSVEANPKIGAKWILVTQPANIKSNIYTLLDQEFKKIMNTSMLEKEKQATIAAKTGAGSGLLKIGELIVEL